MLTHFAGDSTIRVTRLRLQNSRLGRAGWRLSHPPCRCAYHGTTVGDLYSLRRRYFASSGASAHPVEAGLGGELAARLLDDDVGSVVPGADAVVEALAAGQLREEAADEGVTGTVGVDEGLLGESDDRVLLGL